MNCEHARPYLSALLEGAAPLHLRRGLRKHLEHCGHCEAEMRGLSRLRDSLGALGSVSAPDDLALRLRVAISREAAGPRLGLRDRLELLWLNTVRPVTVKWGVGFASSFAVMTLVAVMFGLFATPTVQASDQPVGLATPPRLLYSAFDGAALATPEDEAIVVQVSVDREGRVYDYKVVAGELDPQTRGQLENTLFFSIFQPARVFGQPVPGQAVMSFAGVAVRG